jgi:proteasome maturation protein
MELEVVKATNLIPGIVGGPSTIHEDILRNKSTSVSWEEIYPGLSDTDVKSNFHSELEKRMGI